MVWGLRKIKSSSFGLALGGCQHKLRKLECAVLGRRLECVSGLGFSLAFCMLGGDHCGLGWKAKAKAFRIATLMA